MEQTTPRSSRGRRFLRFIWNHLVTAVAAGYNYAERYRELLHIEEGDIVCQLQYGEYEKGPWKVVGSCENAIDYTLENTKGERITVYRGYIGKPGYKNYPGMKAKW